MSTTFLMSPGHGGVIDGQPQTPGKRSPLKGIELFEGEFTRAIVERIERVAPIFGIACMNLVPTKQDWPLHDRVNLANRIAAEDPDNDYIYLSIHANAGRGKGIEVFTSPGQTASDHIATEFIRQLSNISPDITKRTDMSDGDPDKEARFYELTKTSMPAVLTENFFMDNREECIEYLLSEYGRSQIALAHVAAMLQITRERIQ